MREDQDAPVRTRIPADVDRPDTLMFGFTARQIAILAVAGLLIWAVLGLGSGHLPTPVLLGCAIPIAAGAFGIAVGNRDGLSLDRWIHAALLQWRRPTRLAATPAPARPAPRWIATTRARDGVSMPAPLRTPARGISAGGDIDLGPDGHAAITACSTVNFTLRTPREQQALVSGFAGWLHTLAAPVQILVRAHRVDLTEHAEQILADAPALPHPALEDAARAHATYLADLAASREVLHRSVVVTARAESADRAARTIEHTTRALAGIEVTAAPLDGAACVALLATVADPYRLDDDGLNPRVLSAPDAVITTSDTVNGDEL